jgi:hypothetical protein
MKRKFFIIFPATTLLISIINLVQWQFFEFLLWLFITVLVALIFLPLAFKTEDKDVPVYQVFAPVLLIPVFFSIFAIMDFQKIDFLTTPQVLIYGIITGLLIFGGLLLIIGPNNKY